MLLTCQVTEKLLRTSPGSWRQVPSSSRVQCRTVLELARRPRNERQHSSRYSRRQAVFVDKVLKELEWVVCSCPEPLPARDDHLLCHQNGDDV